MKILADRYLSQLLPAFAGLGEVACFDPPRPEPGALRDCDVLLVRSVTRVDRDLLRNSRVRFVGTATSGIDHVDCEFLAANDIGFAAAPGCNARPVAEYVLSALGVLLDRRGRSFADIRAGIIGCGQVGSILHRLLETVGTPCLLNDPPLAEAGFEADFRDLDEVLEADVVTLHVPLSSRGAHPTRHLLDARRLQRLRPGGILINTARGGVIDEVALRRAIPDRGLEVVLDVWEAEPAFDAELLQQVAIGTPHIAGYSLEARLRAAEALRKAVAGYAGIEPPPQPMPGAGNRPRRLRLADTGFDTGVKRAILAGYDVRGDAATLRSLGQLRAAERADGFLRLRNEYPLRQEFPALRLQLEAASAVDADRYRRLGFQVEVA